MTTENEGLQEFPDRTVTELLALDTYQGMTDTEIQSLIDWHRERAAQTAMASAELAAHMGAVESMVAANQKACDDLQPMLESILERSTNIQLGVISYE